jgi:hypothetical protein
MRQSSKEGGEVVGREPIQGTPQTIIVQVCRGDARANQALDWFVFKELRDQIQPSIAEPQSVEHHRLDSLAQAHSGVDPFI